MNKLAQAAYLIQEGSGSAGLRQILDRRRDFEPNHTLIAKIKKDNERLGVGMISSSERAYPAGLMHLHVSPPLLFYRGRGELLRSKCVTIVGSRAGTAYGNKVIEKILDPTLAGMGITICSGLAYGIDAHVHGVCLERDIPTLAVVAGGVDTGYPNGNEALYQEIVREGCVVAEFPAGRRVIKGMFPMRNRLLAAIADVVIVIEAGEKSGSLITAQMALELGREVLVVPGSVFSNGSLGCLNLIKQGAGIVTGWEDLKEVLVDK